MNEKVILNSYVNATTYLSIKKIWITLNKITSVRNIELTDGKNR